MRNPYFFPPFRFGAWVRAEAATLFTAGDDFGSRKSLDAVDATLFDVRSFAGFLVAMAGSFRRVAGWKRNPIRLEPAAQHDLRPTHSMHRRAIKLLGRLHRLYVLLDTKPVEHRHNGFLAGLVKRLPGDLPCDRQLGSDSFFGALLHFSHLVVVGTFCRLFMRSAIVDCRYVLNALCRPQQQLNTFGA